MLDPTVPNKIRLQIEFDETIAEYNTSVWEESLTYKSAPVEQLEKFDSIEEAMQAVTEFYEHHGFDVGRFNVKTARRDGVKIQTAKTVVNKK